MTEIVKTRHTHAVTTMCIGIEQSIRFWWVFFCKTQATTATSNMVRSDDDDADDTKRTKSTMMLMVLHEIPRILEIFSLKLILFTFILLQLNVYSHTLLLPQRYVSGSEFSVRLRGWRWWHIQQCISNHNGSMKRDKTKSNCGIAATLV